MEAARAEADSAEDMEADLEDHTIMARADIGDPVDRFLVAGIIVLITMEAVVLEA